jgi:hypothetical protein
MVDTAGETTLLPATSTRPIPWSILTDVAPVTFHNKVETPPELMIAGLLLKFPITEGVTTGEVVLGAGAGNVKHPGMRNSNNNTGKDRKTNFFNVVASKIFCLWN